MHPRRGWKCGAASSAPSTASVIAITIKSNSPVMRIGPTIWHVSRRWGFGGCAIQFCGSASPRRARTGLIGDGPTRRLRELCALGMSPIAGLVHHGSGPVYSTLLDRDFPDQLAVYARRVAERYPWIDAYTPINEPLTTARFSALYGHWYPHAKCDRTFVKALLHQCRATVLAMRAVRQVNPAAQLVQTDDAGKTFSTRALDLSGAVRERSSLAGLGPPVR